MVGKWNSRWQQHFGNLRVNPCKEARESLCFTGAVAPGVAKVGSMFPRSQASIWKSCRQKVHETVARARFNLQFKILKTLTVSEHFWKMRSEKCAPKARCHENTLKNWGLLAGLQLEMRAPRWELHPRKLHCQSIKFFHISLWIGVHPPQVLGYLQWNSNSFSFAPTKTNSSQKKNYRTLDLPEIHRKPPGKAESPPFPPSAPEALHGALGFLPSPGRKSGIEAKQWIGRWFTGWVISWVYSGL